MIQKISYSTESIKINVILTPNKKFAIIGEIHQLFEAATEKFQPFLAFFIFSGEKKYNLLNFGLKIFYQISKNCLLELINANFNSLKSFCCKFVLKIFVKVSNFYQIWVI